ncbi:MAG: SDR family NAD(P)-dependent oxidoreductase [Gemmatimonadetes bacterium]|nr:MAG: SDR family NAD(P)-dependent oxidoreductase [Gemmatimonadota bacterium]
MNILITGGAGFIGSNVADAFLAEGHRVIIVDNLSTGKRENLPPEAIFYEVDIRDADQLEAVFKRESIDIIDHHAAQMSVPASVADPVYDANVNVIGLLNLMQCAVKYGVKKVIFISSGGAIYGESETFPITEDMPVQPVSPYAITKYVSEHYLRFYWHQYNLPYTILRYANVYGPRQIPHGEAGVVAIFIEALLANKTPKIFTFPDMPEGMIRDYVFVGDVVQANLRVLQHGDGEAYNIGTGIQTTTLTLLKTIQNAIGTGITPVFSEARAGDLRCSQLDITKAAQHLGWQPEYDLKTGIQKTVNYYRKEEHLP